MINHVIIGLLVACGLSLSQGQSSKKWREDGRCGAKFPLSSGLPGQCNPAGDGPKKGPCCSPKGFCGNTVKHCKCEDCVDYSNVVEEITEQEDEKKLEKQTKPVKAAAEQIDTKDVETVVTRLGPIKGKEVTTEDGSSHYQFLGIPYAQAPVGSLRFKPPLAIRPWTRTLEAFANGPICYQNGEFLPTSQEMSEDCLHLNIYSNDMKMTSKPVMVWIHGGGFTAGSGNDYTPTKLIKEDVIVVTINYRLGSLGFLTFGNDVVSGNMGLKDQALAIQWVKQNIQRFGGNPEKITIFGESAGGTSVQAQVLSPWNFEQIQGAIAQSGTMLMYHMNKLRRDQNSAQNALNKLECSSSDEALDQSTLECLQNVDIEKINEKLTISAGDYFSQEKGTWFTWGPVIDDYATNPFLPLDPLEALKTGVFNRIPFMSGTVKNEGAMWIGSLRAGNLMNHVIENWTAIAPELMQLSSPFDNIAADQMTANIALKYYNHPRDETDLAKNQPLMDLFSDVTFISPDQKSVQLMSKYSQHVFNYYLTQQTEHSFLSKMLQLGQEYTPIHGDDLGFLMDVYGQKADQESSLSNHMVKYWTNFAKFGHPTPSAKDLPNWNSVTENEKNYMELKDAPAMGKDLLEERMYFWEIVLWGPKEENIERKEMLTKATQFLLDLVK